MSDGEPTSPSSGAADPLIQLQWEYVREAPQRLAELRKDLAAFRAGEPDALDSLRTRFHRLAGSGGSYGLPRVTEVARAAELRINTLPRPTPQEADLFEQALLDLKDAFDETSILVGMPAPAARLPGFGYRALLLMPSGPLREEIHRSLDEVGFVITLHDEALDPWSVLPSERPDLVVIDTEMGDNPLEMARYWTAPSSDRPRAVVLTDRAERYERLRTAEAGVDAVFTGASLPRGLAQYARALATIGAPPAHVVVVEDDPSQAQLFATWLGQINARVSVCGSARVAKDTLLNETPDLVLLDVDLPDIDGYALARLMRQDPRLALVPIVFLTARQTVADEIAGLRAGGDDFLAKPIDQQHLTQVVMTRTERGRRIRELVHRDGLTGVLNHATLMAELDHAISFAIRHGEAVCFLMCDLDHFKRVNDTHGHLVGDQVLMHVARVFRGCVRGSDLIGRYGGEEFGIILRRCPPANGKAIADKLRQALENSPVKGHHGAPDIAMHVSIGVATCPGSGMSASDVAAAADRALYRAKSAGRNRVEMG